MQIALGALVVLASMLILALYWAVVVGPRATTMAPPVVPDTPQTCAGCAELVALCGQLQLDMQTCRAAVAGGIEHVDRVENRIRGTIKRARKELEEHGVEAPGLEAEIASLPGEHGAGGAEEAMHLMPQSVAENESSVRGVSPEQLRRVRGI